MFMFFCKKKKKKLRKYRICFYSDDDNYPQIQNILEIEIYWVRQTGLNLMIEIETKNHSVFRKRTMNICVENETGNVHVELFFFNSEKLFFFLCCVNEIVSHPYSTMCHLSLMHPDGNFIEKPVFHCFVTLVLCCAVLYCAVQCCAMLFNVYTIIYICVWLDVFRERTLARVIFFLFCSVIRTYLKIEQCIVEFFSRVLDRKVL